MGRAPVVRLAAVLVAMIVFAYLLPTLSPDALHDFGYAYVPSMLLVLGIVAVLYGLRPTTAPEERAFRLWIGLPQTARVFESLLYVLELEWTPGLCFVDKLLMLLCFACWFLAISNDPELERVRGRALSVTGSNGSLVSSSAPVGPATSCWCLQLGAGDWNLLQ